MSTHDDASNAPGEMSVNKVKTSPHVDAKTIAKGEAHPGDARKFLAPNGAKGTPTRKANVAIWDPKPGVRFQDQMDILSSYWDTEDESDHWHDSQQHAGDF